MSAEAYPVDARNCVRRQPRRAHYEREAVHAVLDRARVAHVGFVHDALPVVIPMMVARDGDDVLLHGARKGRFASATDAAQVCVTVTHVDALVFARSIFHSSMNYRSVVLHGVARAIDDPGAKLDALRIFSEHLMPGRWAEVRPPLPKELKSTEVLRVTVEAASAKIRDMGVLDDEDDYTAEQWRTTWAGLVPFATGLAQPITDPRVDTSVSVPASVRALRW